jgi:hypothetical protein
MPYSDDIEKYSYDVCDHVAGRSFTHHIAT